MKATPSSSFFSSFLPESAGGSKAGPPAFFTFQSAGVYPYKILRYATQFSKGFTPIHVSVAPTNRCQLACSFCSNSDRDRSLELPFDDFYVALVLLKQLGLEAITFTGGEPLLHPRIERMIMTCKEVDVKVGLVTNGICLPGMHKHIFEYIDWVRVSMDESRKSIPIIPDELKKQAAFSYVYTKEDAKERCPTPTLETLMKMADKEEITHLRIVADINNASEFAMPDFEGKNVVVQKRVEPSFAHGNISPCWTSLTHPRLEPSGLVYPCCNIQYATPGRKKTFKPSMAMGNILVYRNHVLNQEPFKKTDRCERCFYFQHNALLDRIRVAGTLSSPEFI